MGKYRKRNLRSKIADLSIHDKITQMSSESVGKRQRLEKLQATPYNGGIKPEELAKALKEIRDDHEILTGNKHIDHGDDDIDSGEIVATPEEPIQDLQMGMHTPPRIAPVDDSTDQHERMEVTAEQAEPMEEQVTRKVRPSDDPSLWNHALLSLIQVGFQESFMKFADWVWRAVNLVQDPKWEFLKPIKYHIEAYTYLRPSLPSQDVEGISLVSDTPSEDAWFSLMQTGLVKDIFTRLSHGQNPSDGVVNYMSKTPDERILILFAIIQSLRNMVVTGSTS